MNELMSTSKEIETSMVLLKEAKLHVWNRIGYYNSQMIAHPLEADKCAEIIEANMLSSYLIDVMMELTRSGLDLLAHVNNKDVAMKSILH